VAQRGLCDIGRQKVAGVSEGQVWWVARKIEKTEKQKKTFAPSPFVEVTS